MRGHTTVVTVYRLRWLAVAALIVGLSLWLAVGHAPEPVSPEQVRFVVQQTNPPPQTPRSNEEMLQQLRLEVDETRLSISSSDGSLKLRIWADAAHKDGELYRIGEGILQFEMDGESTLVVRVQDGVFTQDRRATRVLKRLVPWWWSKDRAVGIVRIVGSLSGFISGSGQDSEATEPVQYFHATELVWDISGTEVRANIDSYRTADMSIRGECMCLDLATKRVTFEGAVEAGLSEL